jgi:diguanylate cyclase (GGDEF)-like protein
VPQWLLEYHDLNLRSLCRRIVTTLGPRLGYRDTSLYLHDHRNNVLTLAETTHQRAIDLVVPTSAVEKSLMAVVARTGRALRTIRAAEELRRAGVAPRQHPYTDDGCLVAPLLDEGRLWGMLNFSGRRDDAAAVGNPPLEPIFTFLGRALHHARAYEQARTEARIDSLTGLYNQRWITESLEREIRRAERFGSPLSVLMLDLDGLKQVNDGEGHAAGDCVLRHVASRISGVLRQFDGAARIGGDEFVVMLPATDLNGAQQVARRLLQSICDDTPQHGDRPLHISASIGAAQWHTGLAARQLLDLADRAMYEAKAQGRGTLTCAATPDSPPSQKGEGLRHDSPPSQREGLGEGVRVGSK